LPYRFHSSAIGPISENWHRGRKMYVSIFVLGCLALSGRHALAQDHGAASENILPQRDLSRHHLGLTGKPCIAVQGYATARPTNKDIFEHWIRASNSCGQHIKVQVCYHKTVDCIVMNVPPWERKGAVLGIYPNVRDFKFDVKEQF
jgi:hypothetical protein